MSTLVIDFPDCSELGSKEAEGRDGNHDTITVTTGGCPQPGPPGPPPLIPWWGFGLGFVVLITAVVTVGFVRYRAHEMKPEKLEQKRLARKQELDAKIALKAKKCGLCGTVYDPEEETGGRS